MNKFFISLSLLLAFPLCITAMENDVETLIKKQEEKDTQFCQAIYTQNFHTAEQLKQQKANPNCTQAQKALMFGISCGMDGIVENLLRLGTNPNFLSDFRDNCSPLYLATFLGRTNAIKLLLKNGASITLGDIHCRTPAMVAAGFYGTAMLSDDTKNEAIKILLAHSPQEAINTLQFVKNRLSVYPQDLNREPVRKILEECIIKQANN